MKAYIVKNGVYCLRQDHSLHTMEALADTVRDMGNGVFLSSIDVSCAYTKTLPLPSGSYHKQCIGNYIYMYIYIYIYIYIYVYIYIYIYIYIYLCILALYGLVSCMYLENPTIVWPDRDTEYSH